MENFVAALKPWYGEPLTWYVKGDVITDQLAEYDKEFRDFLSVYCEVNKTYSVNFKSVFVTHIPKKIDGEQVLQLNEVSSDTKGAYKVTKIYLIEVDPEEERIKSKIAGFASLFRNVAQTIRYSTEDGEYILRAILEIAAEVLAEQIPPTL